MDRAKRNSLPCFFYLPSWREVMTENQAYPFSRIVDNPGCQNIKFDNSFNAICPEIPLCGKQKLCVVNFISILFTVLLNHFTANSVITKVGA